MIFVAIYNVQVAFWESPMRHYSPIDMIQLMKENSSLEVVELWFNLITFMIQVRHLNCNGSFDHSTNTRKARIVLPTIFFIWSFSYYLWVHIYIIVVHIQLQVLLRYLFLRLFNIKIPSMKPHTSGGLSMHTENGLCYIDLISWEREYSVSSLNNVKK